ncbi:MAG TPA: hypothetical protein PKH39_10290 [Woeseiaceae bacterium]|nr:hypothetical protein [Woeseiaceae bacterium]
MRLTILPLAGNANQFPAAYAMTAYMTSSEVWRFVQFFERVSRYAEAQVEPDTNLVITQNADYSIRAVEYR